MKTRIALTGIAAAALVSCENPADKTADATVKDAVEPTTSTATGTRYAFTEDSTIGFVGSKVTGSHEGGFKEFTGHFMVTDGEVTGGEISIDMDSTWSDSDRLTGHLKQEDFFHVEEHPESSFTVTGVEKGEGSTYLVSGNLKLRGVEKNITFPAIASREGDAIRISTKVGDSDGFDIKRKDWGITYAGKADDLIRDEVVIRFELVAEPAASGSDA
jgi:polyisoprenoid-binding protein YceI